MSSFLILSFFVLLGEVFEICPGLRVNQNNDIDFNFSEKSLVCGNADLNAWKALPSNQRKFFIERFLQTRGYHRPSFVSEPGDILLVQPGEKSIIKKIEPKGLPENFPSFSKRRNLIGETLTPAKLDEMTQWIQTELQNRGYGCPKISVKANPDGLVDIQTHTGPIHLVSDIERPNIGGFNNQIFERYEAFRLGDPLDNELLTLSALRIVKDDLFLSAYYDLQCSENQSLKVVQRVVDVKPRLITVGIGLATEGLLLGRFRWKHSRLGQNADSLEVILKGSFLEQSGEASMQWYIFEPASRFHLIPRAKGTRYSEDEYEAVTAETSVFGATDFDRSPFSLNLFYGPSFEFVDTRKGEGPRRSRFLSFKGELKIVSHDFEYYLTDPRRGWSIALENYSRFKGLYAESTFHRFLIDSIVLWNIGDFSPPYAIFGWRMKVGTFWSPSSDQYRFSVPPQLRFSLGGDQDLRGFERKELPVEGQEFRSFLYNGIEVRAGDILPYGIQPLAFFDIAWAGYKLLKLEDTAYMSPGFGIRLASKIGVFRGTGSHGFIWKRKTDLPKTHWQFFLSYGQEF